MVSLEIVLPRILSGTLFCDHRAGYFIPLASILHLENEGQRIKLFLRSHASFSMVGQQEGRDVKEEVKEFEKNEEDV